MNEKKKRNEETFIKYLVDKKQKEKERKRTIKLKRESEAAGGSLSNLKGAIDTAIEKTEKDPDMQPRLKLQTTKEAADEATDAQSSSSSEEGMNTEGLQAIKDIQKLTGSNLDVAPLNIDVTMMRQFVHTPKNGVKIPLATS